MTPKYSTDLSLGLGTASITKFSLGNGKRERIKVHYRHTKVPECNGSSGVEFSLVLFLSLYLLLQVFSVNFLVLHISLATFKIEHFAVR